MSRSLSRASVVTAILLTLSCAAPLPAVDDVLALEDDPLSGEPAEAPRTESITDWARELQLELDERASEARANAPSTGSSRSRELASLLAGSRALFDAADARILRAQIEQDPGSTLADVLTAEDEVARDVRAEVAALCAEGLDLAERALELEPESCRALLERGLHLSLLAWAEGAARALLAGRGPRVKNAIDRVQERCAEHEGGAPLRLAGRFRTQAPWPYRDTALAVRSLTRAVALEPNALNLLFLGDALYAAGDLEEASAAWSRALEAQGDGGRAVLQRELARRRVDRARLELR